jgi:HprK-related kinase B
MKAPIASVEGLVEHYAGRCPCQNAVNLVFGDYAVDVLSNNKAVTDWLDRYYVDFKRPGDQPAQARIWAIETEPQDLGLKFEVKQPDPGKTKIKEEWAQIEGGRVVRKRLTGMEFIFGEGRHLAVGPCLENVNQVVNFVNNRFIEYKLNQGCLLGHAAGVAWQGRGMSLAGFSGMGKSTLALHMMNHDLDFVSNDRVMIGQEKPEPCMYGVAKMPRVNPGTVLNNPSLAGVMPEKDRLAFKDLPLEELWSLEHKYDAYIDECFGQGRFKMAAQAWGLVILNWKHQGQGLDIHQVDLGERRDLLEAFMKSTGLFYDADEETMAQEFSEEAYVARLGGIKVFEITGGADFPRAAAELSKLLKQA